MSQVTVKIIVLVGAVNQGCDISQSPPPGSVPMSLLVIGRGGRILCTSKSWHLVPISSEVGVQPQQSTARMHFKGNA